MAWTAESRARNWYFGRIDGRYLTKEEKRQRANCGLRNKARGVCNKCGVGQRVYNMTICRDCHNARQREYNKRVRAERKQKWFDDRKRAFVDKVLKHRCALCREWLLDPFTKTGNPRYACKDCYKALWAYYRLHGGEKPFGIIREAIRRLKLEAGILPRNAWQPLSKRGRWERAWMEVEP